MGYVGTQVAIPLGQFGLITDESQSSIPANAAIKANNIMLYNSKVLKSRGSAKYSATALEDAVVALYDWWPSPSTQRLIACTANGKIWKDTGDGTWSSATPIHNPGSISYSSDTHIVAGGVEAAGNNRKLFFFDDTEQVQVLSGDGGSTSTISAPASDWSSNYPTFGIIYQGRLFAFGNANLRHTVYVSTLTNHEDFTTTSGGPTAGNAGFYPVFTGEGDGLVAAMVYRGVLLLFKRPFGVYVLDWRDTTAAPFITRFSDSFGIGSPHSTCITGSDLFGLTNTNSVISLQASDKLGSLEQGDVLKANKVREFVRNNTSYSGAQYSHCAFYPEKEQAFFTMRSPSGSSQDRMLIVDLARAEQARITFETKDQPNCLALRKDTNYVPRPMYGDASGFVYLMDQSTRAVGAAAYTGEFQTPYMDFGFLDQGIADKNKIFDFLSVSFVSTGAWNFYVDVYCGGEFVETLTFGQSVGAVIGSFELDVDRLGEEVTRSTRKPLHCTGRTISFRIYNTQVNEDFVVERMVVGFRLAGENVQASRG